MSDTKNEFNRVIEEIDRLETEPDRHLSIQLDKEIKAIVRAAKQANKPAELTLKIKAVPGADRRIVVGASFKSTLPKPAASAVSLYADEDGGIHQSDPMQVQLPLGGKKSTQKTEA